MSSTLHDLDAERFVIGCLQESADAYGEVAGILAARDFHQPNHATIYTAIAAMVDAGKPVEPVAVAGELTDRGELSRVGGAEYLHTCLATVTTVTNAGYYARRVRDCAFRRRLTELGERYKRLGHDGGDVDELTELAHTQLLDAIADTGDSGASDTTSLDDLALDALDDIANPPNPVSEVTAPFLDMQALIPALEPGRLVTIAGRPSMGKSVLAIDFARHNAIKRGHSVLYVTLEMSRREISQRILAAEGRVLMGSIKHRNPSEEEWKLLADTRQRISGSPLHVSEPVQASLTSIRARLRSLPREDQPKMLVVDHVGLMESEERGENRQSEMSVYSRGLKQIARQFDIPVLMVSQLNRNVEQRPDRTPQLSDLRDSGSLEQDSDIVLLLHREDERDPESPRAGEADIHVAKNRAGATGVVTVAFQGHYQRFVDMAPQEPHLRSVPN